MWDAADLLLGSMALLLAAAAFAVGGLVILQAWRGAFGTLRQGAAWSPDRLAPRSVPLLRGLAAFEAIKGLIAAAAFVAHLPLPRMDCDPALVCAGIERLLALGPAPAVWLAAAYVALCGAEAGVLWLARPWAERLGALCGGLCLPFEAQQFLHGASILTAGALVANLAIVVFLIRRLRARGLRL